MNDNFISFDLEFTDLNTDKAKIFEFSAIETTPDFVEVDRVTILMNPGVPIPAKVTELTGVTDDMVKDLPTFDHFKDIIFEWVCRGVLTGYNIESCDIPILMNHFLLSGIKTPWPLEGQKVVDALVIYREVNPATLTAAYEKYTGKKMDGAHKAENDVIASLAVLEKLVEKHGDQIGTTIEKLSEIGSTLGKKHLDYAKKIALIDGVACYAFGKDRDKPVKENPGFGSWMLQQSWISANTKEVVKALIAK